jgi:arginine decarboxylase
MEIKVTYGVGEGLTELAAFDRALYEAGIANFNLIKLSSVIPPNSTIKIGKLDWNQKAHGDRLYVVLSDCRETVIGKEAWAGLGWVTVDSKGKGIFVEHTGSSEEEVKRLISESLESMRRYREEEYGEIRLETCGVECQEIPVCALVCAVYKNESWD